MMQGMAASSSDLHTIISQNKFTRERSEQRNVPKAAQSYSQPCHRTPRRCRVKKGRFQYGGANRATKGRMQNEITISQPCGEPTCIDCKIYNPHLIWELPSRPV